MQCDTANFIAYKFFINQLLNVMW